MKKKNLSAKKKIHNFYIYKQKNPKIRKIYYEFKKNIEKNFDNKLCVAISGGPDRMSLAFLDKYYSIQKKTKFFYCIVDHKLRSESTKEAKITKERLRIIHRIICV